MLRGTGVLIVPAGCVCASAASEVAALINLVESRILVPVHFHLEETKVELGPLEGLLSELGVAEVTPRAKLGVDQTTTPGVQSGGSAEVRIDESTGLRVFPTTQKPDLPPPEPAGCDQTQRRQQ